MTTTDIPDIKNLAADQLLALRANIDAKLDEVRTAYIQQCEALGLKCTDANGKKPRRKSSKHHED
jgi:hypothetical protein